MERVKPVDVVVVGGGWTGLIMAKEIATRTSHSVLVLERGAPPQDYSDKMDELDYVIRLRMMQKLADETITHRHSSKDRAVPVRQYGSFNPGTGVGGAGEHWGAVSNRYRTDQFALGADHLRGRAPGIPAEPHGSRSYLHRQFRRSPAAPHARLDRP